MQVSLQKVWERFLMTKNFPRRACKDGSILCTLQHQKCWLSVHLTLKICLELELGASGPILGKLESIS